MRPLLAMNVARTRIPEGGESSAYPAIESPIHLQASPIDYQSSPLFYSHCPQTIYGFGKFLRLDPLPLPSCPNRSIPIRRVSDTRTPLYRQRSQSTAPYRSVLHVLDRAEG